MSRSFSFRLEIAAADILVKWHNISSRKKLHVGPSKAYAEEGGKGLKERGKDGLLGMILSVDTEGTILDINHVAWSLGDFYFLSPWGGQILAHQKANRDSDYF